MVAGGRELLLADSFFAVATLWNDSHVLKVLRMKELCEVAQELNIFRLLQLGVIRGIVSVPLSPQQDVPQSDTRPEPRRTIVWC